jgi:hypothetical protein
MAKRGSHVGQLFGAHGVGASSRGDAIDPVRLTERGLAAVAAAREGSELYIHRFHKWYRTSPDELEYAEKLALTSPQMLVQYGAEAPRGYLPSPLEAEQLRIARQEGRLPASLRNTTYARPSLPPGTKRG